MEEAAGMLATSPMFQSESSEVENDDHFVKLAELPMREVLRKAAQRVIL